MPKIWNDTGVPLAFLITFRCYGTWLHGDKRGSVDRDHNYYGEPRYPERPKRKDYVTGILKGQPVRLNAVRRASVEKAIRETCRLRAWILFALNVRTNHVHCVVDIGGIDPNNALVAFKANSTREMRSRGCWQFEHSPWAAKGSKRYLWIDEHVSAAIDYVLHGQGDELPAFD